jgi:hypothetical protein
MNAKEIRNMVLILAVTFGILTLAKPRTKIKSKFQKPEEAKPNDNEFENAVIAIKAYRAAINDNVSTKDLNDLNRELLKEYNIRVIDKKGQLVASNRNGVAIANEDLQK